MKNFRLSISVAVSILGVSGRFVSPCQAQVNSWTNPSSGNWEDSSWSLGTAPGTNQFVMLTNAGWKAVQIGSGTARILPQSLNVDSITIASPTNSFNTLLLNFAGFNTPLTVKSLSVASNSTMTMLSSALQLNGPNGEGMTIGGQLNQSDSIVNGNQVNVGYVGPGVYNLNSGVLNVSDLWVGGAFQGVFNQNGGTNATGITHLEDGDYVLNNGYFAATIYFEGDGEFTQQGGLLNSPLTILDGAYVLNGGVHFGDILVPTTDGFAAGSGAMLQTGGTNEGSLNIGSYGQGSYIMSNGVSSSDNLLVGYDGSFAQWGGVQTISGMVSVTEQQVNAGQFSWGSLNLGAGQISSDGMFVGGHYSQSGGTNISTGDITMSGLHGSITLSGGLLTAANMTINPSFIGGVFLTGGTLIVSNQLWVSGSTLPGWQGFSAGGELAVADIYLAPGSKFLCGTGVITQSGTLTLANANLYAGTGTMQFGQLQLSIGGNRDSTLFLPASASIVRFAAGSGMTWSNESRLIVENWSGSPFGGGQQQIFFGNNSAALATSQLSQIQFHNPAGAMPGTYAARILSNGEIVPDTGVVPATRMALCTQSNGMQLTLQGEAGLSYGIEVSTDLVHWAAWTSCTSTNGTILITDTNSVNCPMRFYRARLMP